MTKGNSILNRDIDQVAKPNIVYLEQCGLSARDLTMNGLGGAWVLVSNPEKLKALVVRAEELGVPRSSGAFKYALATVSGVRQEKLASRIEVLKGVVYASCMYITR